MQLNRGNVNSNHSYAEVYLADLALKKNKKIDQLNVDNFNLNRKRNLLIMVFCVIQPGFVYTEKDLCQNNMD